MLRSTGAIKLIYKPGSRLGAGTVISLPYTRTQCLVVSYPADTMTLSEDGGTFTYTVDLSTGEYSETFSPKE